MRPNPSLYTLDTPTPIADVVGELREMPAKLREVVTGAPRDLLGRAAGGDWSAFQTLCHFRDAALVYSLRFRHIVFDVEPRLPNYDENNWVAAARDTVEDAAAILDEIAASRADLVRVLSRLDPGGWARTGRHDVLGLVVLEDYVRHHLAHERMHLEQIHAALTVATA